MVALSHATARELGYELPTEDAEEAVRRGVGTQGPGRQGRRPARSPRAQGAGEVAKRNPEFGAKTWRRIGRQIAVAAVRYFMIKYSRGKVIAFDIDEALSFEGESGPYLQYAVVRANNIFAQAAGTRLGWTKPRIVRLLPTAPATRARRRGGRRALGPGARSGAARRSRRAGGAVARILGAGEVRVRAGAAVQRVLSPRPDPERGAARMCACGARPASPTSARS